MHIDKFIRELQLREKLQFTLCRYGERFGDNDQVRITFDLIAGNFLLGDCNRFQYCENWKKKAEGVNEVVRKLFAIFLINIFQ